MTVTLYGFPGACSMSPHIALILTGIKHNFVVVDKATGKADGVEYKSINPTGAVPTLKLEDGSIITQNAAIFWWIGQQSKKVCYSADPIGQVRLVEQLGMLGDLHSGVASRIFGNGDDAAWKRRLGELEGRLPASGWTLGGSEPSAIDLYTAVILNWNNLKNIDFTGYPKAHALYKKVFALSATQEALKSEGLA